MPSRTYHSPVTITERLVAWHQYLRPDLDKHATASVLGVSTQTVTNWWTGRHPPTHEHLGDYTEKVLDISMEQFWSPVPKRKAS